MRRDLETDAHRHGGRAHLKASHRSLSRAREAYANGDYSTCRHPGLSERSGSIGRRSGLFLASRLVASAGFFVSVVVLAHGLAPADRGAMAFLTVTASSVGGLVRLGVSDATLVLAARTPAGRAVLLSNLLLWTLASAATGALCVAAALVAAGEQRPNGIGATEIGILFAGVIFSAFVDAGYPILIASGRVREQVLITAAGPWAYAVTLAAMIWSPSGLSVTSAAVAWVTSQALSGASLFVASARGIGLGRPNLGLLREALAFGVQAWVGSVARFLGARFDQILMGLLASTASLGVYAVAVNAADVLFYLPAASAESVLSTVSRDAAAVRAARVTRAFRATVLTTAAVGLVAAVLGPFLVPFVFGDRYGIAVLPFLLLLPGGLGFTATSILSSALLLSSSPRLASVGPALVLLCGIGLDLVLIPSLDAAGAAIAASVALLVGGIGSVAAYRYRTGVCWRAFVPMPADAEQIWWFARDVALRRGWRA